KALLKAGEALHTARNLGAYGLAERLADPGTEAGATGGDLGGAAQVADPQAAADQGNPLEIVREKLSGIKNKKFMKAFEKTTYVQGQAKFTGPRTVSVDGQEYTAKYIYIATGTVPNIPPIPGLAEVPDLLTNVNLFELPVIPQSMTIIGGGAIGCEMAQAFRRLGCQVSVVHIDQHIVPLADQDAAAVLQEALAADGIKVYNAHKIEGVSQEGGQNVVTIKPLDGSGQAVKLKSEKVLVAAGRSPAISELGLEKAGIKTGPLGIKTDKYLRTNRRRIFAVGDCNGYSLFSHSAMHQGMLALMRAVSPLPMRMFQSRRYQVPWAVFTQPELAEVGINEKQAREHGIKFEVIKKEYRSYGRTVADGHPDGFIKVITNPFGRIYGVTIVGQAASELIHEWVFAIQHKKSMFSIMMMQHAFPSISMINKMVCEDWMMKRMESRLLRRIIRLLV
ncbi:MAG: NAD(P)/FAD-dependent oxidoreductase, partial [Spirochaetaceae bacterium]